MERHQAARSDTEIAAEIPVRHAPARQATHAQHHATTPQSSGHMMIRPKPLVPGSLGPNSERRGHRDAGDPMRLTPDGELMKVLLED
jgi:hypothetical protein